jgi:hypothetical protein
MCSTRPPRSATSTANSAARRPAPDPLGPRTTTVIDSPSTTRRHASRNAASSRSRPTNGPGWDSRAAGNAGAGTGGSSAASWASTLAWLDAKLVNQDVPGTPVRRQRVRLPPGLVQGHVICQDQQMPQPLPQPMPAHQRLQLGDRLAGPAHVKVRGEAVLERHQPQLLEPSRLARAKARRLETHGGRAAPQRERLGEGRPGRLGPALPPGPATQADQPGEPPSIDCVVGRRQPVARAIGDKQPRRAAAARLKRVAQAKHVGLQRLRGRARWSVAPQTVDQLVRGDHAAGAGHQVRQVRALLDPGDLDRSAFTENLERAEHGELHLCTVEPAATSRDAFR